MSPLSPFFQELHHLETKAHFSGFALLVSLVSGLCSHFLAGGETKEIGVNQYSRHPTTTAGAGDDDQYQDRWLPHGSVGINTVAGAVQIYRQKTGRYIIGGNRKITAAMTGNDDAKLLILSIAPEELNSHGDLLDLFGTINGDHATIGFNGEAKDCISFDSLV